MHQRRNLAQEHLARHHPDRSSEGSPSRGRASPQEGTRNPLSSGRRTPRKGQYRLGTRDPHTQDRTGRRLRVAPRMYHQQAAYSATRWGTVHRHKPIAQLAVVTQRDPAQATSRSRTRSELGTARRQQEKQGRSKSQTKGRSRWVGCVQSMVRHGEGVGKDSSSRTSESYVGSSLCDQSLVDTEGDRHHWKTQMG
jgi:hypothetical protein